MLILSRFLLLLVKPFSTCLYTRVLFVGPRLRLAPHVRLARSSILKRGASAISFISATIFASFSFDLILGSFWAQSLHSGLIIWSHNLEVRKSPSTGG